MDYAGAGESAEAAAEKTGSSMRLGSRAAQAAWGPGARPGLKGGKDEMKINWKAVVPAALAGAAIFGLTACSPDQIAQSLDAAVNAAVAVAPAIEKAANVPADTQAIIGNYLAATQGCLASASATLRQTGLTARQQAIAITAGCVDAVAKSPALPAGTPANVVAAVQTVVSALSGFLNMFAAPAAPTAAHTVSANADTPAPHVDPKTLDKVDQTLAKLRGQLAQMH